MIAKLREGVFLHISENPDREDNIPTSRYLADQVFLESTHAGGQLLTSLQHVFPYAEIVIMPVNVKVPGGRPE